MNYSIVVPIYNDGYLARALCEEIRRVFSFAPDDYELIFIEDGSKDDSLDQLLTLLDEFNFIRIIELSRNFGQHQAIACGFREARGEIIIRLNVDMQDPPSELPKFIQAIQGGHYDIVIGIYAKRSSPLLTRITSMLYFSTLELITGLRVSKNSSPMRLMNRRYIDAYNQIHEKFHFPQGLEAWLGFKKHEIEIEHTPRSDGKSSYTFIARLKLALYCFLYFSDRPIKLMMGFGFLVSILGFFIGLVIMISKIRGAEILPGYASTVVLLLIAFGIHLCCLGLVGLYVGRIFVETKNRPLFLIRQCYEKY